MDCACDVYVESDCGPSFYSDFNYTARKTHKCCECRREILPGEKYNYCSGMWDGDFHVYKTCPDCVSIRNEFFKNGWTFGDIIYDLSEHLHEVGGDISEDCVAGLTPKARERVADIIQDIFGDENEEED